MKPYTFYAEENKQLEERFLLAKNRIQELLTDPEVSAPYDDYTKKVCSFLSIILDTWDNVVSGKLYELSLEELQNLNHILYEDILPEHYFESYANPDYAVKLLGREIGQYLCVLYAELRSNIVYVFEQHLQYLTMTLELFLEIHSILAQEEFTPEEIRHALYYYCFDYADITTADRTRSLLDPSMDFATRIILNCDLHDMRYLYYFGEYISNNELQTASYLSTLPLSQIQDMSTTYTEGFRKGFEIYQMDLNKKETVNIRYTLGFERMVKEAILQFHNMGLNTCLYRAGVSMTTRSPRGKIGYYGGAANKQYDYDHRMDDAIIFDKAYADRRLAAFREAYQSLKKAASLYAGPAVIETFGELPFTPEEKATIPKDSEKQRNARLDYQAKSSLLTNEFIPGDEVSFTIIAYPVPEIGKQYTDIFTDTIRVNTLDQSQYEKIQTSIIEALDQGESVTVTGRNGNHTNITVSLADISNSATQTKFENCLADVNIPLGEVFTTPKLKDTCGVLHVSKSHLGGLCYHNLQLTFQDGIVTEYTCENFDDVKKNQDYIKNNLLFQHDTLPMGEFAIGTNTTAYAMGQKYHISHLLPILIEEKTGPHFAIGDTCFSHEEEMRTYNPDGKEMIAKENDYSRLRYTDSKHAYFNCHTDITIPYHELDMIVVNTKKGEPITIIQNGKFVLPGTEILNEAL